MYKKITAAILAAVMTIGMTACGDDTDSSKIKRPSLERVSISEKESIVKDQVIDSSSNKNEKPMIENGAHAEVGNNGAAAVYEVCMYSTDEPLDGKVRFKDLYGVHVMHSRVVGLVGAPIEVDFDPDEVKGGTLLFKVLKNELNGVRPDALMFMWYDEEKDNYVELDEGTSMDELDDSLEISISIDKPGVYLLVNKYAWLKVWGADIDDDGLEEGYVQKPAEDPFDNKEDESLSNEERWKAEKEVGDIIDLADFDYIDSSLTDNGAEFNVETLRQLASACYYVNCCEEDKCSNITINLMEDIDLSGVKWAPMGWWSAHSDNRFMGVFNGNGHTISNLKVDTGTYAGFFGGTFNCTVKDLSIVDADIKCFRNAAVLSPSDVRSFFSNIYVSGVTSSKEAGTMLGSEAAAKIIDCRHDVLEFNNDGSINIEYDFTLHRGEGSKCSFTNKDMSIDADLNDLPMYLKLDYPDGTTPVLFDGFMFNDGTFMLLDLNTNRKPVGGYEWSEDSNTYGLCLIKAVTG